MQILLPIQHQYQYIKIFLRSHFQVEATITELKPVKQNVTYDTSTGKMYAELGASTPCPAPTSVTQAPNSQPYFQSYQAPTSAYSPYPTAAPQMMQPPSVQYSSAYSTTTYTSLAPYDRFSATTPYPFSTPGAILPHSAINLSVKTEEASGQTAELSPQILDLTRPLRYRSPAVQCSRGNNLGNSFEYPAAICPSSIFPSCFTAFIFLTLLVLVID